MPHTRGRAVLAAVFAILALEALAETVLGALGYSDSPAILLRIQSLVAATGAAAAWGTWRRSPWASIAAVAYALATGAMIVALGPLLGLPAQAAVGLWTGAAIVFAFGAWAAWYLRSPVAGRAETIEP